MKRSPEWKALRKVFDEEWWALDRRSHDAQNEKYPYDIFGKSSVEETNALREALDKTFDAEREELRKKHGELLDAQQAKDEAELVVHLVWWVATEKLIKFSIDDLIDKVLNSNLASLVTVSSEKTGFRKTGNYGRPKRFKFVEVLFETTFNKVNLDDDRGGNLVFFLAEYTIKLGIGGRMFVNGWPWDGRLGMAEIDVKEKPAEMISLTDWFPRDPESLLSPRPPPAEAGDEATGAPVAEVEDEAAEPLEEPTEEQKPKVWSSGRDPSQPFEPKK